MTISILAISKMEMAIWPSLIEGKYLEEILFKVLKVLKVFLD